MDNLQGKHFSITDPNGVNTVIYKIDRTEKEFLKTAPKYTLERLDFMEEMVGNNKKKTFFVDDPSPIGKELVILSFAPDKVVVNSGILEEETVAISKKPKAMKFDTLYNEEATEIKDMPYTPNLKRPITIIDPETTEEVKPILYFDEVSKEVKGKCKLKPYKSYFTFEIREDKE